MHGPTGNQSYTCNTVWAACQAGLHSDSTPMLQHDKGNTSYPIHVLRSCLGGEHGQDPSPTPDIQHYFVLEDVLVVVHGVPVGERPHFVLQHLLVKHMTKIIRRMLTQLNPVESDNLFCWITGWTVGAWICCGICSGAVTNITQASPNLALLHLSPVVLHSNP